MKQLYDARYQLQSALPEQLWWSETLLLDLTLENCGLIPWLHFGQHPVRIAYRWQNAQGIIVVSDGVRSLLPHSVPPNTSVNVELRVESPPEPGIYQLFIDLVEEGVTWFSEKGVSPLTLPTTFLAHNKPKACIINGNCVINDAVGSHIVAQLQALTTAGYQTLLITEFIDSRLPIEVRRSAVAVKIAEIKQADNRFQWLIKHFISAELVIVNYSTYYDLALLIKQAQHATVIFDYHGVTPPHLWDSQATGYTDLLLGQQNLNLVQYADFAIAHSQYTRNELIQTEQIPAGRVSIMPYAVITQPKLTQSAKKSLIEQYSLEGKQILLYVGRMAPNKRILDLVEALALVKQKYPAVILFLVGDNQSEPYQAYLKTVTKRAKELYCSENIIWTGQVPEINPYYDLCDLFVTASVHEGFCMPVVEAMARGKPVIAAAATALPETVGSAGLLFEPQNPTDLAAKIMLLLQSLAQEDGEKPQTSNLSSLKEQTIAFVTPRYGLEIVGGAERLIRGWAEQLVRHGYYVEILTTCTAEMNDWSNHHAPGVETINGVIVRRFLTDRVDSQVFHQIQAKAQRGESIAFSEELAFVEHNLRSNALNAYLRDHSAEFACVIFAPYLFGTTYWGMQVLPEKSLIVPCLHDEPGAYFAVFREMLEGARGILFNTQAEADFARDSLNLVNSNCAIVGLGFEESEEISDKNTFRNRYHLPNEFLLYSGRAEEGKNVPLLLDYFIRYKAKNPNSLALVLIGSPGIVLPAHPDFIALGILPEEELPNAFAEALALCQPSLNESFSIVLMESWLQGRPVLVHEACPVTSDHVKMSGGGYTFADFEGFCNALDCLLNDSNHAAELGQRGKVYVLQNYAWEKVLDRLIQSIILFSQPQDSYSQLAQRGIQRSLAFTHKRFNDALFEVIVKAQKAVKRVDQQKYKHLEEIAALKEVCNPSESSRSFFERVKSWVQKQTNSPSKNSYNLLISRQEHFNRMLLERLFPLLEQNLADQRELRREVELLRDKFMKK